MSYQQIKKNIFKRVAFGSAASFGWFNHRKDVAFGCVAFKHEGEAFRATFGIKSFKPRLGGTKATLRVSAPLPAYQLHTSAQPLRSITSADFAQQTFELPSSATNSKPSVKSLIKSKILASPSDAPRSGDLRERFIQRLILDGKKSTATKVFDESLQLLKKRIEQHNLINDINAQRFNLHSLNSLTKEEVFLIALRKAQPWITTSSLRRGGKKVIIPEMLTPSQQESIAIRWLILNSRSMSRSAAGSIAECLASEFFGCLTNQGKTINQREQLHKLAEANRAWAN